MAILAGQRIRALDYAGSVYAQNTTDQAVTAIDWTPANGFGVSFMAPTSGAVQFGIYGRGSCTGANANISRLLGSVIVRLGSVVGSGTLIYTPSDDEAWEFGGVGRLAAESCWVLSGLAPGSLYNASYVAKMGTATHTGTFFTRGITVRPWNG